MRAPPARFTLRAVMVAVASVAVVLAGLISFTQLNDLSFDYGRWSTDSVRNVTSGWNSPDHASEMLRGLQVTARQAREEVKEYRRMRDEAQSALDARRNAGQATTQQERREPWYWGMRVDEAEWALRVAETRVAILEGKAGFTTIESYLPSAPPVPAPPPP